MLSLFNYGPHIIQFCIKILISWGLITRPVHTQDNRTTDKTQAFMIRVGFEHTIPMLKRVKIFHTFCATDENK
jgi:hypothetical protein